MKVYPIKNLPAFKQYIWGGDNLQKMYNKSTPEGGAAESWELSCHIDGGSKVEGGIFDGMLLRDIIGQNTKTMYGAQQFEEFPILIKLLDARDDLSVQVHPGDDYAKVYENDLGKTEMWYVLSAAPDAKIVYGVREGVTKEDFSKGIREGILEGLLNYIPAKAGDSFFIPAGTIHAVGGGLVIAEIQQSSNTTYRVYDYNRRDKQGNTRDLHIEKALEVADFSPIHPYKIVRKKEEGTYISCLADCDYFKVFKYEVCELHKVFRALQRFEALVFVSGKGFVEYEGKRFEFSEGDTFFIPGAMGSYSVCGKCEFLRTFV